ncbi:NAD(P)/FAD-dependent oxidoreductase [Noviherbaspirillum galbum]|uniref:NAD(P)/FAD-dependent oxidoreductase n=1 Tax=Noviherbaspirillum galbum TaxID=2709383 RepID=A0A6B3SQ23_9BURK|nr:NAD(P)/FAD-dependent oxidoreductase [Noviherbaspirillum galbum]NEX62857.1 NAD(P)/FAD-dependent oxidoreductase [Noviherbaspirillum galbum]
MDELDCVVVGAGVVGLAVARELAMRGRDVVVVEQHGAIGAETSSRNSEVIHAGLYYPTGSLKARLCVQGRDMLYDYCAHHGIPLRRCGKLIVATREDQAGQLDAILAQAHANGCGDVVRVGASRAREMEPSLSCIDALHSPSTGILDSHAYMLALRGDAERAGAVFAFGSRILGGQVRQDGVALQVDAGAGYGGASDVLAATVINCAGLWAPALAASLDGLPSSAQPAAYFAKGNYYALAGKAPFTRLIYPVPQPGGLGVHLTLDLGGQARFGPDVEWITPQGDIDYTVDPRRADAFYAEIRAYWPDLPDGALHPAYAGVRPKLAPPGAPAADFRFERASGARYLGLYGIESPGLTASLAIARHAADMLRDA